ncbi:MAG: hypothetical protein IJY10_03015 [Lachnospiraceae bacterium]|nr:hypothetical protein [Lachnospiraceae bacterium]
MNAIKTTPRFINDTQVQVTKAFAKNARIFGTPEYKLWREIRMDCPNAEMVTKTIKRNPSKKVDTRNMTYANMEAFIKEQDNANELLQEMKKQIAMSKVQTNPYRSVLAWFLTKFKDYDSYKDYFMEDDTATTEVAAA